MVIVGEHLGDYVVALLLCRRRLLCAKEERKDLILAIRSVRRKYFSHGGSFGSDLGVLKERI